MSNNFNTPTTESRTDDWLTPPSIIKALGEFDLDPCATLVRPWDTAKHHYTIDDDGLKQNWFGRVWLNPPYSKLLLPRFIEKMSTHCNGIALIFARTDTQFFHKYIFPFCDSLLFVERRINFYHPDGTKSKDRANAPSVFISYGKKNMEALADSGISGSHVFVNRMPLIVVGVSPTWKAVVTMSVNRLNGEAELQQVYELVEQIAPDKVNGNKHYREKIRQQLQYHFKKIGKGKYANKSEL